MRTAVVLDSPRVFLGIDPGLDGAAGVLVCNAVGRVVEADLFDVPTVEVVVNRLRRPRKGSKAEMDLLARSRRRSDGKRMIETTMREYALPVLAHWLRALKEMYPTVTAAIEKTEAKPRVGVPMSPQSMWRMGYGVAAWEMGLAAADISMQRVPPSIWKPQIVGVHAEKEGSRHRALQLFPACADRLQLKNTHNRAEALLIGEWLRRQVIAKG